MGKYMKKKEGIGGAPLVEMNHVQASLGVCTRAKTLALQRLQKSSSLLGASAAIEDDGSYLQLRSRRLKKSSPIGSQSKGKKPAKAKQVNGKGNASSRFGVMKNDKENEEEKEKRALDGELMIEEEMMKKNEEEKDLDTEKASYGENFLELEGMERTTRETTPCSLIRDPDTIRTPSSSTRKRHANSNITRGENTMQQYMPITKEMNEFFEAAEKEQQRKFIEKYNFDPVKGEPLPGRYEWVKLKP